MKSAMARRMWVIGAGVSVVIAACSGGEVNLTDYATELEQLVVSMNSDLDELDALLDQADPDLDDIRTYARRRVDLRDEFVAAVRALEPPDRLRDFHDSATHVIVRLADAERVLAESVMAFDDPADASGLWETEEGRAARAVDAESVAICKAAEAEFNATEENAAAQGVPWIPTEMKEIVRVAFFCERVDRP